MWECIFCSDKPMDGLALIQHLREWHNNAKVQVGKKMMPFSCLNERRPAVLCICGKRFEEIAYIAPAFLEWASAFVWKRFRRHLEKHGGMAAHLQALRDEWLVNYVGKSLNIKS